MNLNTFLDRTETVERLEEALHRPSPQFVVIYGRRRIGKSTLIRHVMDFGRGDIYFLADKTAESNQRALFASVAALTIHGFDAADYRDWESLLRALNRQIDRRVTVCFDEFPYLAKNCPSLPSVIQKLLNERVLKFDLIICGSSQQLMQGYVLNRTEPLYGLADEIIRLQPIPARYICEAMNCTAVQAVEEYAVWGGIPRYWELRLDYPSCRKAIDRLLLDANGFLRDEPLRLLLEDLREATQTTTILSIIGKGVNKISEIASRAQRDATAVTEPIGKLMELGFVRREIPFGENAKSSKRSIYRISDPLTNFYYRFVAPYMSLIEMGQTEAVKKIVAEGMSRFTSDCWEELCRHFVAGREIDGVVYNVPSRWWGKHGKDKDTIELDLVAESLDHKHILIAECKWTVREDAARLMRELEAKTAVLPFVKDNQQVHHALFLKVAPKNGDGIKYYLPEDVI